MPITRSSDTKNTAARRGNGKTGKRRLTSGAGVAGFVIAAAVFGTLMSAAKAADADNTGPAVKATQKVAPKSLAWSIPAAEGTGEALSNPLTDPHLFGANSQRIAAWTAVAGLFSAFVAMIGANRLLNWIASAGAFLGRGVGNTVKTAGKATATVTLKAAKSAAKATARVAGKPGRWLLAIVSLTVFALTGVAFLDIQWEAGLLAGAGMSAAAMWGWRKSSDAMGKAIAPLRRKAPQPAVKPAATA